VVEEFMLLANIAVARRIWQKFPSFALLRRHPSPSRRRFDELLRAAEVAGVELKVDSSKALADSLDAATRPDDPMFNKIVRILATRCMSQAVYFCAGERERSEYAHYGLATPIYTHFTSPIRRYADVVAHRMLAASIGIEPMPAAYGDKARIRGVCEVINRRSYAAQMAGRDSTQLYTRVFFKGRPRNVEAVVLRVRASGVGVLVPEFGFEGFVRLAGKGKQQLQREEAGETRVERGTGPSADEGCEGWTLRESELSLTHARTGRRIAIFDRIEIHVRVRESEAFRDEVELTLVDEVGGPAKKRARLA
jgi:exosome complex exonuclease DIS3/RRP44